MPRASDILIRAIELAESGDHLSCASIEQALRREGYKDAAGVLQGEGIRTALRVICRTHWSGSIADPEAIALQQLQLETRDGGLVGGRNDGNGQVARTPAADQC